MSYSSISLVSTIQSGIDDLEREVKSIIKAAGYDPRTLILKAVLQPGQGWMFEALASVFGASSRRQLSYHFGTADDFLRHLRRALEVEQLKLDLA